MCVIKGETILWQGGLDMPKRTLEEIHKFNRRVEKKLEEERKKRWEEWKADYNKPKNMKRESAKKRYKANSELRALNQFKEVLEHKCTLDDFIKNRCYCKRPPNIEFLHSDNYLTQEDHCKGYLNSLLRELSNRELFMGFVEFLGNKTKPFIHKKNTEKHKLLVETYPVDQRYGLIVMCYNDEGKFSRFILKVVLNEDHRVTKLEFIYDAGIYNYVFLKNLKLPPERKKVTHYMDGIRYLYHLSDGSSFTYDTGFCKGNPQEAVARIEERMVSERINLDKKPKIIQRRCPKCGGYLEKFGKGDDIVYQCHTCRYAEYENVNLDEPIMKCPECGEGDAVICYKWSKKKKKRIAYVGCTNAPGCTLHLHVKENKIKKGEE